MGRARMLVLEPGADASAALAEWARVLRSGGVVAFATDTVWGLGALARDAAAIARIFAMKGRDDQRPMACLIRDAAMARGLAPTWGEPVDLLARRYWPGALTVVVDLGEPRLPAQRGLSTLGLRVPDRRAVLDLLDLLGEPLAATSANRSGQAELGSAADVMAELGDEVDLIVDDRSPVGGIASTVVEWNGSGWRVLRHGGLTLDESTR